MNKITFVALMALAVSFTFVDTTPASAQNGCFGSGYGDGAYFGFYNRRWLDAGRLPPYFSQFPPVYYSAPIARPYGWSPFAIRPQEFDRLPTIAIEPKMVLNPFVKPESTVTNSTDEKSAAAPKPKMIINPFVTAEDLLVAQQPPAAR